MKRFVLCFALALTVATVVLSQLNCAAPTNDKNDKVAAPANANRSDENANNTDALANNAAVEKELTQMENDWANTVKTRDVETMKRIEAEDITLTYPDGTTGDRAHDINDITSGALTADAWTVSDMKVRAFDQNAAVVTGLSTVKNGKYKGADGKAMDISGNYRFTDTFIKRNGRWQVVASQSTKVAKP
jgi:hypothetical protein